MKDSFIFSQLTHIAEDRDCPLLYIREYTQRSLHRHRVCVIAVVDDSHADVFKNLEAAPERFEALNARFDFLIRETVDRTDDRAGQRIHDLMPSGHGNQDVKRPVIHVDRAGNAFDASRLNIIGVDSEGVVTAVKDRCPAVDLVHPGQLVVLTVQHNGAIFKVNILKALCLGLEDTVAVFQELKMAGADVGDDHGIWTSRPGKVCHLSEMTYPHLKDSDLMLIRDPEDRERKSEIVVEVSCSLQDIIFLGKDRGDHLLCRCLADGTGNSHDRNAERYAIEFRNSLDRDRGLCDLYVRIGRVFRGFLDNNAHRALFDSRRHEIVTVVGPPHGDKKISRSDCAAVSRNAGHLILKYIITVMKNTAAGSGDVFYCHILHVFNPLFIFCH